MASSNRHWPSMFKSKPSCNSHHQWQHDINSSLVSNACQRTPYSSGCEERSPEPKPRWNPRPEQIRILEAIFNSGMVNPPRDEIRKIRAQLQEYGQVGDANVFYWFQNRKSRSKHKQQRHNIQNNTTTTTTKSSQIPLITSTAAPTTNKISTLSSSSSSSEKSSQNSADNKAFSLSSRTLLDASSSSPTASVNQNPFFQNHSTEFLPAVPFFFPVQQPPIVASSTNSPTFTQGFSFTDAPNVPHVVDNPIENSSSLLLSDLLLMNHGPTKKVADDKVKLQQQLSYSNITTGPSTSTQSFFSPTTVSALSSIDNVQVGPTKSTVFINDVAFEVTTALFNVKEAFGDDAMLLYSSGQPVLTNEWGVTLQPLQHGAFYYLIRTLTSSTQYTTIDLALCILMALYFDVDFAIGNGTPNCEIANPE
ncbi:hypothetical protein ACH5RR_015230 [Cinchona calisaya]|uniref:Protein WUSCHEL n=1 Tax=Cinchona calisaya TaxID=153742 RepID=A0ABD2ZSJ6_9GENT